jgi:hypothetical protein
MENSPSVGVSKRPNNVAIRHHTLEPFEAYDSVDIFLFKIGTVLHYNSFFQQKNDEAATSEAASTRTMALGDDPTVTVSIRAPNGLRHKGLYSSYESIYTWWVFVSTDAVLEEKACLWIGRPSGSMDGG